MILFDKNKCYSTKEMVALMETELGFKFANLTSFENSINGLIRREGYKPVNRQKSYRKFAGIDCQKIYEHFVSKYKSADAYEIQVSFDDIETINRSKTLTSVNFSKDSWERQELERRSRVLDIPKVRIVEDALKVYFELNPLDEYDEMTAEELRALLRTRDKETADGYN